MSCVNLLPLCSIPKAVTREGGTGAFAYLNAVGLGIWFASGAQMNLDSANLPQDTSRTFQGTTKPNTFRKGFPCNVDAACPPATYV